MPSFRNQIFTLLLFTLATPCAANAHDFNIKKVGNIIVSEQLLDDAAMDLAAGDLSRTLHDLYKIKPGLTYRKDLENITAHSILIVEKSDDLLLSKWAATDKGEIQIPALAEEGFMIRAIDYNKKPILLISGNGVLGTCYGVFRLIEQLKINRSATSINFDQVKEPDMTLRMITQPFEATGYPPLAHLEKPITQHLRREFDPMRPWEGAGYDPEAEAKNVLRAGLNTIWVGNFAFATLYDGYDPKIFPKGSEARKWVEERRKKIKAIVNAAEKYHLHTMASSDIFAFPKNVDPKEKWKMLEYSLNEFLTDYPQIDWISTRFGENYSYFNSYFGGEGIEHEEEFAEVVDFIHQIVSKKYGKKYMPRTWALGNKNWGADPGNYLKVIENVEASDHIVFSVKNTRTDFWRYNLFNPVIGVGDKEQASEILCQDSYHFKAAIPYYEVMRMAHGPSEFGGNGGLKEAYKKGVRSAWGWLTADGWCGPYIKREEWLGANIYGLSHLAWDVQHSPRTLAKEWAAIEFSVDSTDAIAENIMEILMLSEKVMLKSRYFHHYSMQHEGWVPARNWIRDELIGGGEHSTNSLSVGKSFAPGILKPIFNPGTIAEDISEKMEAAQLVNSMVAKFEEIKERIPDQKKANEVYHTLLYAKYLVYTLNYYVSGMFRYYNEEFDVAAGYLRDWKICWDFYNKVIPELDGTATLMLDGGMVATVDSAMTSMGKAYDSGIYPNSSYEFHETDHDAVHLTIGLPKVIAESREYLFSLDFTHIDPQVENLKNLALTFATGSNKAGSVKFGDPCLRTPLILQGSWASLPQKENYRIVLSFEYTLAGKAYKVQKVIRE